MQRRGQQRGAVHLARLAPGCELAGPLLLLLLLLRPPPVSVSRVTPRQDQLKADVGGGEGAQACCARGTQAHVILRVA